MNRKFIFFPVTLFLLAILSGVAWMTGTHTASLSESALNEMGFSPADVMVLDLKRILTSFFVTTGPNVFALAFFMIALAGGAAEWRTGSFRTLLTFFGVHIITLALVSAIVLPLHWLNFSFGSLIALSRDVGPSAGYFGVLGLALSSIQAPWRKWIGAGVIVFLVTAFLTKTSSNPGMEYSADMAHLIAFPLGWISLSIRLRKDTKP